jgi:DMSO/TMAO reductase YedYZ heme-binding membrane subunit
MFVRWENILWIFTPSFITETEFHITLGRFALVLTLIVWITSAIVRSKIKWRPWKYIHLLSYPILFFLRRNTTLDNVIKIKERPADGK